jgi:hypothetical protein
VTQKFHQSRDWLVWSIVAARGSASVLRRSGPDVRLEAAEP